MGMLMRGVDLLVKARDFRYLMGAQFLAQAGDGLVQAALAKLIVFGEQEGFDVEGARSPDELLRIVLYIFVPYTILSPFLGVVIDRWDRRRLLFVSNALRGVVVAIVGLVGTGTMPDLALFLAFLLTLAGTRIVLATKAAALPETVEDASLVEANAVSQLGGAMFQLGGAGVALVLAGVLSAELIVLGGALVYAAGAVSALLMKRALDPDGPSSVVAEVRRVARSIAEGVREVARTPQAASSITTYFWLRLLWSFSIVGLGFIARDLLANDEMQVVLYTGGAAAVGAVVGFVLARVLLERVRTPARLVVAASVVAGGAVALFGALLGVLDGGAFKLALAGVALLIGFGFFLGKISLDTMVQQALGDDFRGRAFSIYDIAYNLAWVVAAALMKLGWQEEREGVMFAGMGLLFLVGIVFIALWFRRANLFGVIREAQASA